jgi:hypothetical protein
MLPGPENNRGIEIDSSSTCTARTPWRVTSALPMISTPLPAAASRA